MGFDKCIKLYNHYPNHHPLKLSSVPAVTPHPTPQPQTGVLFLWFLLFQNDI